MKTKGKTAARAAAVLAAWAWAASGWGGVAEGGDASAEALAAAEGGDAWAQYELGTMYAEGRGVEKDGEKSAEWFGRALEGFRAAGEGGDTMAQANAGLMYMQGRGTEEDGAEAAKWLRMAAEKGVAKAQNNLGWLYETGFGVEEDGAEAAKWYRLAAEQGHAKAQCNLGWLYETGFGVERDEDAAAEWYRKAAEQGDGDARERLAEMEAERAAAETFGLDAGNPVRLQNVDLEYAYLARLSTEGGGRVRALRWGSLSVPGFEGPVDRWSVEAGANRYVDVYMHPYAEENTLEAPAGFRLDTEGIEEEFGGAWRETPPAGDDGGRDGVAAAPNTPEEDAAEAVRAGGIEIPPPDGCVDFRKRAEWAERAGETALGEVLEEEPGAAVFAEPSENGDWGGVAVARIGNDGAWTGLGMFRLEADLQKAMLYRRGPGSGTMAPHRSDARSLQWTIATVAGGGRWVRVQSFGLFWLKGRSVELEGKVSTVPAMAYGMWAVAANRRFLEDWEDKILRANGASADPRDFEREMKNEEIRWRAEAGEDGEERPAPER